MKPKHRLAVIPDVHMRRAMLYRAQELDAEGYPLLFLGDYVDNGPRANDPGLLRELFSFATERKATLLLGNHDLAYFFPEEPRFRLNGYEPKGADEVAQAYDKHRAAFKFVELRAPYLFSHAGLSQVLLRLLASKYGVHELEDVVKLLNEEQPPELFYRGRANGGPDAFDGPTWLRLPQYRGALQSLGVTQVVGHSSQARIRVKQNLLMVDVGLPLVLEWG